MTTQTDPMIGRLIDGRYQVRSRIARGGMATVYLATDLRLERRVAIKIMHGHLADDSAFKSRFVQEARSAARLAHPNVVNVFDQGQDSDMAYLVMEYLPGITLRDLLNDYGQLTPVQTLDIMSAVLNGLAAAHKAGIVHRDLKPENVLLADDGRIKISDFGLARAVNNNTATGEALLGTIAYLSPELVTRGVADARSDIYALGIMLYEMLAGEQPFHGEQPMQIAYQHANDTVPTPSTKNPDVPVELDELVLWATAREPDQRPRDASAMLEQLIEAENLIHSDRGDEETTVLKTAVLPRGYALDETTGETQVLGPRMPSGTTAKIAREKSRQKKSTDSQMVLATKSRRRHRKGFWLFALVILTAAVAGGTGWYFGSGPGGMATVPAVSDLGPDSATKALQKASFVVTTDEGTDPTIAAGRILGTKPDAGTLLKKGSDVTLIVSIGPKNLAVPAFAGKTETDAKDLVESSGFTFKKSVTQFDEDVAKDVVIRAQDPDGKKLGKEYPEQRPVVLVVSLGSVPDVEGDSLDNAQARLKDVKLTSTVADTEFNDDVEKDHVISMSVPDGVIKPGAEITLTVSKGPDLVEVPDVIGMTRDEAVKTLKDNDFDVTYAAYFDYFPDGLTSVQSVTPEVGTMQKRFATISLGINGSG